MEISIEALKTVNDIKDKISKDPVILAEKIKEIEDCCLLSKEKDKKFTFMIEASTPNTPFVIMENVKDRDPKIRKHSFTNVDLLLGFIKNG